MMIHDRRSRAFWRRLLLTAGLVVWATACSGRALAGAEEEPAAADRVGWVLRVSLPITGTKERQVKQSVDNARTRAQKSGVKPVLIFEFVVPSDQEELADTSQLGLCSDLADFLSGRDVSWATTVAYLPQSVRGHAVLPVLACDQVVMSPEAELGPAGIDEGTSIAPKALQTYEDVASLRKKVPVAVALGLLDKRKKVLQVETEVSREYVLAEDLEALRKRRAVQPDPKVLFEAGEPGRLTGREARDLGFIDYLAPNRRELARLLDLPPEAVEEDPSLSRVWKAAQVNVKGPINATLVSRAQRMIEDAIRGGDVNFVCLWVDSPGGSLVDSLILAVFLARLDPGEIRTVAFVPNEALADAALIALACDHVMMSPGALLGGEGDVVFSEEDAELARTTIRDVIAKRKSRSWSLPAAMIAPNLEVFRYELVGGELKQTDFFSEEEQLEQLDPDAWEQKSEVTEPGRPFQADGKAAVDYRLAVATVENFAELKDRYGLADDPALLEPGWADFLIDVLADARVAALLLVIGFSAMYAEFQAPGIGIGGFLALVCFLLFFWSKFLGHTAEWLEVLLFLTGVICLLLEVFVIPGFGIFGLGGGLLILVSLILASQTFVIPGNDYQFAALERSLTMIAGTAVGVVVVAVVINRWLPQVPALGGIFLKPPSKEEAEDLSQRESLVHFEDLAGAKGTTTTQLTPGGKARFGNRLVNVIADGEVIPGDTEIVVVEVIGNRVIVRPADEAV
ncbi:MAG: NfeD family protein [Planctomycetota bacterium]|jgi:membrane-bound ClpP family serine protease